MPLPYTPPAVPAYVTFPTDLIADGDPGVPESINSFARDAFDSIQRLKLDTDEVSGRFTALLTKLGLTVINPADVALPTYAGNHVLTSAMSHQTALNTLDAEGAVVGTKLDNVAANVGGLVTGGVAPVYASGGAIFNDGDSHHVAIEKLEDYDTTTRALATAASSAAASAASGTTNIAAKLGSGAELAPPWNFAYESNIVDGQIVKDIIDKFDALLTGSRVLADQAYGQMVKNFIAMNPTVNASFYDTMITSTKAHGSTTTVIDVLFHKAQGAGNYVATFTAPAIVSEIAMIWDVSTGATIAFSANAIGSLAPIDFVTVASQRTFVLFAVPGTAIVIRAVITGGAAILYNIAAVVKP
jgi:hypothetical protein